MCLYPKLIKNKRYTKTKKNGGIIPPIFDKRVLVVPAACGLCHECKKMKSREWQARLIEEVRGDNNGLFVTLTFNRESLEEINDNLKNSYEGYDRDNKIATYAVRHFFENWRKKTKKSVKHWLITELGHGTTEHIHLHGIIWSKDAKQIQKLWRYGYSWVGYEGKENYINEKTVNYLIKYITKEDEQHRTYKPKIFTSKGIGKHYIEREGKKINAFKGEKTNEIYKTRSGHKLKLPIYWRNKLYTEDEKEALWIDKLNKNERWVWGEKIKIENGDESEYYKLREFYRKKAKRLGANSPEMVLDRKAEEEIRRNYIWINNTIKEVVNNENQ